MYEVKPDVCIFGPTASGKSHLALSLAQLLLPTASVIINSDSLQLYSSLPILTAQPTTKQREQTPHYLYGIVAPSIRMSAGIYANKAKKLLYELEQSSVKPITIICGGAGLYLKALVSGLTELPEPSFEKKQIAVDTISKWQQQNKNLYKILEQRDPVTAKNLNPRDSHRIIRALEFFETLGKPLHPTQKKYNLSVTKMKKTSKEKNTLIVTLNPTRELLYKTINQRFLSMLKDGAIDEAKKLRNNNVEIPLDCSINKTLGLAEIYQYLDGIISYSDMVARTQQLTRNYAKRQTTWMRHQLQTSLQFNGPLQQSSASMCKTIINSLDKATQLVYREV